MEIDRYGFGVACAGVTLNAVATAPAISVGDAKVTAEGDLDFRGTLGVDREAPVGFTAIRLKLTERYCAVYQSLKSSPAVAVSMH